jgi:hypothetical protein
VQGSMQIGRYKRFMQNANQFISNTGFESSCSTKGKSCRFSPLETPSALCPPQEAGFTLNQIISIMGYVTQWSTKGESYRFSPCGVMDRDSTGGNPTCLRRQVGHMPAASRGVS